MWLYLNNAFVSIVADRTHEGALLVRARRRGDIEAAFPAVDPADVLETPPPADYRFRTSLMKEYVAGCIAGRILGIRYENFKNSIGNDAAAEDRHRAYLSVWGTTSRELTADPRPRAAWLGGQAALPFPPSGSGDAPFAADEAVDRWRYEIPDGIPEGYQRCIACGGTGEVRENIDGLYVEYSDCNECEGTGVVPEDYGADAGPETMTAMTEETKEEASCG